MAKIRKESSKNQSISFSSEILVRADKKVDKILKICHFKILRVIYLAFWSQGSGKKRSDESGSWTILICFNYSAAFVEFFAQQSSSAAKTAWEFMGNELEQWNFLTFFKVLNNFFFCGHWTYMFLCGIKF